MADYDVEKQEIYVNSPKVLEKAREHFNCHSLKRLPLENQGDTGTLGFHWEERYMLGDYMVGTSYMDNVISDITLALFEDSGFYKIDYYAAELFRFGKNKGCEFFNKKCIEDGKVLFENEFCFYSGEPKCTQSRISRGECIVYNLSIYNIILPEKYQYFNNSDLGGYPYTDFCPVSDIKEEDNLNNDDYLPLSCNTGISNLPLDYGEKIGDNSFCFVSSLLPKSSNYKVENKAICYDIECDNNKKQIIIHLGDSNLICPENGGNLSFDGFKGELNCPKYSDICDFKNNDMCNEMFDCISNRFDKKESMESDSLGKFIKYNFFVYLMLLICYHN